MTRPRITLLILLYCNVDAVFFKFKDIMKKFNLIWLLVLLHNTDGSLLKFINSQIPECISVYEMYRITEILCHEQRHNRTLWKEAIACHRPISDEVNFDF